MSGRQFIQKMHSTADSYTGDRAVGLYRVSCFRTPVMIGSGVALELGPERFVITAAHVLDRTLAHDQGIYLSPGIKGGRLVSVPRAQIIRSAMPATGNRDEDPFDIAVIHVLPEVAQQIGPGVKYCQLSDLGPDCEEPPEGYYLIHGFPKRFFRMNPFRRTVRARTLPYGTVLYDGNRGNWVSPPDVPPAVYIDLDYDKRKAVDHQGRRVRMPHPAGLSGCGVWRLCRYRGEQLSSWSLTNVKLVAIEHSYSPRRQALRCTNIAYALQLIIRNFPDAALAVAAARGWPVFQIDQDGQMHSIV